MEDIKFINALTDVDVAALTVEDIESLGSTGVAIRSTTTYDSGKILHDRDTGVATRIGNVKASIWDELAKQVVANNKADAKALERVEAFLAKHGNKYVRNHDEERMHQALLITTARQYNDKNWSQYEDFQRFLKNA